MQVPQLHPLQLVATEGALPAAGVESITLADQNASKSVAQFRTLVEWHKGVFSSHFFLLHKPTSRAKTLECILCDVNSSIVLGFF